MSSMLYNLETYNLGPDSMYCSCLVLNDTEEEGSYTLDTWQIENTRGVSFDSKFTRQGFENAC